MQSNDIAEKLKLEIDGVERKDFVSMEEISSEKAILEVPEYARKRKITDGVIDVPVLQCVFKVQRDSDTVKYFKDWYFNNEVKDVVKIRTDAHGVQFGKTIFPQCECAKYTETAYEGTAPTWSKVTVTLVPYDIIPIV